MQKKLIAAAVAGLIAVPALAQSNVTISGRLATGYENYRLNGGVATGQDTYNAFSDQSSRIIFNVNEDLGGGLSAWGQMDFRFDFNGANGVAPSGNTAMGLAHKSWGKLSIGRWDVHYNEIDGGTNNVPRANSLQTFLGNGLMSQMNGTVIANGTRTQNLIMWDSPNWNGFTARLAYSTAPFGAEGVTNRAAGDPGDGHAWTGAIRYTNGPWKLGVSHWNADAEGSSMVAGLGDQRSTRAWGSYVFGMGLSVGLAWDRSRADFGAVTRSRNAWMIPVNYAFGPHKVYFSYARAGDASNTAGDSGANAWNLGYDYAFSKRTSAGIYYTKVNNKTAGLYDMFARAGGGAALLTAAGEDARQWYIGMAHNF